MAIRANAGTYAQYVTTSPTGDFTAMMWVYIVATTSTYTGLIYFGDNADYLAPEYFGLDADGLTPTFSRNVSGITASTPLTAATWYHLACSGNTGSTQQHTIYQDGVQVAQGDFGVSLYTTGQTSVGSAGGGDNSNTRFEAFKFWNRKLTLNEVVTERRYIRPVSLVSLWQWAPFISSTQLGDFSGNARDFSAVGSLTTEDGPPISWGPRQTRWRTTRLRWGQNLESCPPRHLFSPLDVKGF